MVNFVTMELPQTIILASRSPRRKELLERIGWSFSVVVAETPEVESAELSGLELACVNALRKAEAVAGDYPDHWVLGADTVVTLGSKNLGKPRDREEAVAMLGQLSGQTHRVYTGVSLVSQRSGQRDLLVEESRVSFRVLDAAIIKAYCEAVEVMDKAGAYAVQDQSVQVIDKIEGSVANVMGLPVESLIDWARRRGLEFS